MIRLLVILLYRGLLLATRDLSRCFACCPGFRDMLVNDGHVLHFNSDADIDDKFLSLQSCVTKLDDKSFPHRIMATELNRLVLANKEKRISPMTMRYIDYVSTFCELEGEIHALCPQATLLIEASKNTCFEAVQKWVENEYPNHEILFTCTRPDKSKLRLFERSTGIPDARDWTYPVDKIRTKERTETMQTTEKYLDMVWQRYDSYIRHHTTPRGWQVFTDVFPANTALSRTPDWVAPALRAAKKTPEATAPVAPAEPATTTLVSRPKPSEVFVLNRKAYKPFSILFFQPTVSDEPGMIPWTDFLYALNAIGLVPEKRYGSVWCFTPNESFVSKVKVETPITFDEPHPESKLPYLTSRYYGQWLYRTYGLDRSSFQLE
ncbi:unnamed protein product [Periconia digitata]|uniref:Uncharacterized protein n=1 Tax=Periconia digitata TaxID=1303443 RepID=A0A9W4UTU5_9PLEO|nr:unnamed protein product [Periconia digitata]